MGGDYSNHPSIPNTMKQTIFALIDCNNFFVSCEKLFRPDLEGKPVVVLSSNDGCVVARSQEAKVLGIPMGAPAFKYKRHFHQYGVVQFSANFELYGDISRRITSLLTSATPRVEVYSVDESFLDLSQLKINDYTAWGREVRKLILQHIGIPVSIGIAPTKTLAKLASDHAKKNTSLRGVLDLTSVREELLSTFLQATAIEDVWGVGRRLAPLLRTSSLTTAYDLARLPPKLGQQLLGGVRGEQLVRELNGTCCFPLEAGDTKPKSIARTRTFGEDTNEFHVLEAAVASFAAQAAFQLRRSNQLTRRASFFLTTSRHKPAYRSWDSEVRLNVPTCDSGLLINLLVRELSKLYEPNTFYHRAGVLLYDFLPSSQLQADLFGTANMDTHAQALKRMQALDRVNARYGRAKVHYAAEDLGNNWRPKHHNRSPSYTSNWSEIPLAQIM